MNTLKREYWQETNDDGSRRLAGDHTWTCRSLTTRRRRTNGDSFECKEHCNLSTAMNVGHGGEDNHCWGESVLENRTVVLLDKENICDRCRGSGSHCDMIVQPFQGQLGRPKAQIVNKGRRKIGGMVWEPLQSHPCPELGTFCLFQWDANSGKPSTADAWCSRSELSLNLVSSFSLKCTRSTAGFLHLGAIRFDVPHT